MAGFRHSRLRTTAAVDCQYRHLTILRRTADQRRRRDNNLIKVYLPSIGLWCYSGVLSLPTHKSYSTHAAICMGWLLVHGFSNWQGGDTLNIDNHCCIPDKHCGATASVRHSVIHPLLRHFIFQLPANEWVRETVVACICYQQDLYCSWYWLP